MCAPKRVAVLSSRFHAHTHGAHALPAVPAVQGPRSKLSQELVAVWADEYSPTLALLRRIFPPGLVRFLSSRPGGARQQPAPARHASAPAAAMAARQAAPADPLQSAAAAAVAAQQQQQTQAAAQAAAPPNPLQPPEQQQLPSLAAAQPSSGAVNPPPAALTAAAGGGAAAAGGAPAPVRAVSAAGTEVTGPPSPLAKRFFSGPADKHQGECMGSCCSRAVPAGPGVRLAAALLGPAW